jgi:hypothetical protein
MKHNKEPNPNCFLAEFYQVFRKIIKHDLMALFKDINNGSLDLNNLNFGIITLLIKQKETTHIKRLFHISLLNASIKIFAKVGANRIIGVTPMLWLS